MATTPEKKARPVHEARSGPVRAAVWENTTRGRVRYNVSFSKRYRDGEEWKSTSSFGERDLFDIICAAVHAHTWMRGHTEGSTSPE